MFRCVDVINQHTGITILKNLDMLSGFERVESKSLVELRALLVKTNSLYDSAEIEDTDKIKLLDKIGELENKIRAEVYKERLLNGEE